ncbi:hypothetical protein LOK49_LG01G02712 [Camellia lanceoleosa]|uniref:Uncharacterized protein n=1 Tax=Camellia lanceoleosa TaxID=1840588 RepID=A0ACC0IWK8_9ERIC|nr:hypothetical protein LOK49_LG01G02712 [Camellia lanceoleosa]
MADLIRRTPVVDLLLPPPADRCPWPISSAAGSYPFPLNLIFLQFLFIIHVFSLKFSSPICLIFSLLSQLFQE